MKTPAPQTRDATHSDTRPAATVARRGLIGGGGLVAAAAALVTALHPDEAAAFRATPAEKAGRYQESAHVKRFYALNRR